MEGGTNTTSIQPTDRRKSGRSTRKPELFAGENYEGSILSNGSKKRKRTGGEDAEDDGSDQSSSDDQDEEADEEELKENKRVSRARKATEKHSVKKVKTNGESTKLAFRSATTQAKPNSKNAQTQKARSRPSQMHQEGLYAEVFGQGKSGEDVATEWYESLQRHNVNAIRDLVNFILKCVGCDLKVETFDIEDLDNVPSKLGDIVEEFQQTNPVEYPLVSKLKSHAGFRTVLTEFFKALIKTLHTSSVLYDEEAVFENIQTWVATMSGAPLRPFRHTATVISLIMSAALCDVAAELQNSMATTRTQIATETKKKSVNKGRVKTMEQSMKAEEKMLETVDALLKDSFDTVFVHRYRDVDEKIRVECAHSLGEWIVTYRKMFLEGQYLRYLGWVLSDTNTQTRLEVIKQLKVLYKDRQNIAALRAFTERFRSRIVEMGARDTDASVRVETIDLLDTLRNAEMLEPNDIDTIGKLIFDAEPRIRKAVSKFFVSNIQDLFNDLVEDMDGEQLEAALMKSDDNDDYMRPTQSWLKFKCLAQTLGGNEDTEESDQRQEKSREALLGEELDSRYMLATLSIFPNMKELHNWTSLAGYLLYDHSQVDADSTDEDISLVVQRFYKLDSGEESVLLDVLYSAVKLGLQEIAESQSEKKNKKTKASKDAVKEKQEQAAQDLTQIVPQLLKKFGSTPQAAASILRLEQLLDADLISDLQEGDVNYSSLLDDINKQFTSHSDRKVLAEASRALRQARSYETAKEAADAKVQELWTNAIGSLQNLLRGQNIDTRGTLPIQVLTEVSNTVSRLSNLAGVSDCTAVLESKMPPPTSKRQKGTVAASTLLDLLLQLAERGKADEDTTATFAETEDELCLSVIATLSLYFRWKVFGLKSAITANNIKGFTADYLVNLALCRVSFVEALTHIITSRTPLDSIRISATLTLLDIFTLFSTVRHMKPARGSELPDDLLTNLKSLYIVIPEDLQAAIIQTHDRLEKSFAKRTRRKLERTAAPEPGEHDAPIGSDDEHDEDDEAEDGDEDEDDLPAESSTKEIRKQSALLAEQLLCEVTSKIVLGIIGSVIDIKVKQRLMLNRTKLGKSYMQVLAYLEDKKGGAKKDRKKGVVGAGTSEGRKDTPQAKSSRLVLEEDDIEDEDDNEAAVAAVEGLEEEEEEEIEDDPDGDEGHAAAAADPEDDIMGD